MYRLRHLHPRGRHIGDGEESRSQISASDIKVTKNGTLLTSGYTVDGLGTSGGNVTLDVGATAGDAIVITGSTYFWFALEKVGGNFIFE